MRLPSPTKSFLNIYDPLPDSPSFATSSSSTSVAHSASFLRLNQLLSKEDSEILEGYYISHGCVKLGRVAIDDRRAICRELEGRLDLDALKSWWMRRNRADRALASNDSAPFPSPTTRTQTQTPSTRGIADDAPPSHTTTTSPSTCFITTKPVSSTSISAHLSSPSLDQSLASESPLPSPRTRRPPALPQGQLLDSTLVPIIPRSIPPNPLYHPSRFCVLLMPSNHPSVDEWHRHVARARATARDANVKPEFDSNGGWVEMRRGGGGKALSEVEVEEGETSGATVRSERKTSPTTSSSSRLAEHRLGPGVSRNERAMAGTPPPGWVPMGSWRTEMIVVATAGTVSCLCTIALVVSSILTLVRHWRKTPYERKEHVTSHVLFLSSSVGALFLSLIGAEIIQALGYVMGWKWIYYDSLPPAHSNNLTCTAQGVVFEAGDIGTSLSAMLIGLYLFSVLVLAYNPPRVAVLTAIALSWSIVLVITFVGFSIQTPGIPFYGPIAKWCWITPEYQYYRLWFHYLWIFATGGLIVVLYIAIIVRMVKNRTTPGGFEVKNSTAVSVAKMVLLYPLIFLLCALPSCIYRLGQIAGRSMPAALLRSAPITFAISGTIYTIVHICTRRILEARTTKATALHQNVILAPNARGDFPDWEDELNRGTPMGMAHEDVAFGVTLERGATTSGEGGKALLAPGRWKVGRENV
ncbi:integral membrane protein, glucose receptor Git3 [Pseudohyphozyma bogoriensis]|nr:integral membrane protein, glucose receptor Git3 [Pseudohyphozyma bogoriensis]